MEKYNIKSTLSHIFQIGKKGPSIITSTIIPTSIIGNDGDLFILKASDAKVYQKVNGEWITNLVIENIDGGTPVSVYGGTTSINGGTP
jgi:hypothetical protein